LICDPEAEYFPLVNRLEGQVIKISPTSTQYVNPMDMRNSSSRTMTVMWTASMTSWANTKIWTS
ncbi:hypothetical protein, partial [Flavonifractor plautii]|uniref:hypothetical protein n=1 Tax=Flavonifractor plautii TaxID=292800 RepID=UPI0022E07C2F